MNDAAFAALRGLDPHRLLTAPAGPEYDLLVQVVRRAQHLHEQEVKHLLAGMRGAVASGVGDVIKRMR